MPTIDERFIDPKTGRIRPLAEYAPEIANAPANSGNVGNIETARPHWFKADGTIKTTAEIRDEEARAKLAEDLVAAKVRARTRKTLTDDERLIQSLDSMIDKSAKEAKYSTHPAERVQHQEYVDHLKSRKAEVEGKIADEKRVAALSKNRQVQLAKEYAETYQRSPPRGSTAEQVAVAIALANRTDCDPETLARDFWTHITTLEEAAGIVARSEESFAREQAYKAEHTAVLAKIATLETEQRLHQAQEAANGPN